MRILILIFSILYISSGDCLSQQIRENRWSIDGCFGGTNAVRPFTPDYFTNTIGLFHTSVGPRFMFSNNYGIKIDVGYDRLKDDQFSLWNLNGATSGSEPFRTNYYRASIQGVLNLGRLFKFENFSEKISLLFHTGGGLSQIKRVIEPNSNDEPLSDNMVNFLFGFTPQIKLNDRMALFFDASFIWHIYQQYTFDMNSAVNKRGFDGFIANANIGLNIYLGKNKTHYDWSYTPCFPDMSYLEEDNIALQKKNENLENQLKDDDGDGVINYLDEEPNTEFGARVNTKGMNLRYVDSDNDGVNDLYDECPNLPGLEELDGCPETVVVTDPVDTSNIAINTDNGNNNTDNGNNNTDNGNNNTDNGNNNTDNGNNNTNNGNNNTDNGNNNTNNGNNNTNNGNNNSNNNSNNNTNNSNNNTDNGNNNTNNNSNNSTNNGNNNTNNNSNPSNNTNTSFMTQKGLVSLGDIHFVKLKDNIQSHYIPTLKQVVLLLKENKSATLLLAGHADNVGEEDANDKLSLDRAVRIKKYLTSLGISSDRIKVESYGEKMPKFLNSSEAGKQLNRRVEMYIKYPNR